MDDREGLLARIAALEAALAGMKATCGKQLAAIAAQAAQIAQLEAELRRRGKRFRPKPNVASPPPKGPDRRRAPHRKHAGQTRSEPPADGAVEHHDVFVDRCPDCGERMEPTGEFSDHYVEDIPEPKVEVHRYRRHRCRCTACGATAQGRSDLAAPGGSVVSVRRIA